MDPCLANRTPIGLFFPGLDRARIYQTVCVCVLFGLGGGALKGATLYELVKACFRARFKKHNVLLPADRFS